MKKQVVPSFSKEETVAPTGQTQNVLMALIGPHFLEMFVMVNLTFLLCALSGRSFLLRLSISFQNSHSSVLLFQD